MRVGDFAGASGRGSPASCRRFVAAPALTPDTSGPAIPLLSGFAHFLFSACAPGSAPPPPNLVVQGPGQTHPSHPKTVRTALTQRARSTPAAPEPSAHRSASGPARPRFGLTPGPASTPVPGRGFPGQGLRVSRSRRWLVLGPESRPPSPENPESRDQSPHRGRDGCAIVGIRRRVQDLG